MKVVLFCGGLGLRMGGGARRVPKPMVTVGGQPIVVHVMNYYAHFGHTEFILCLGYKADTVIRWFSENPTPGWDVTFVDSGLHATVGQRLFAARHLLAAEPWFLANYGDCLTDAALDEMIDATLTSGKSASFLCVRPTYSFHVVRFDGDGQVRALVDVGQTDLWINGGYFVLSSEIFDHMGPDDELVEAPFQRLISAGGLRAHRHDAFWAPMDTLKDRQTLEALWESGRAPWAVWARAALTG
jgi:glucose-1-phosphate cytidylyltransferase